ncbi:MAG: hypothetical protein ABH887_01560 [bacterium]
MSHQWIKEIDNITKKEDQKITEKISQEIDNLKQKINEKEAELEKMSPVPIIKPEEEKEYINGFLVSKQIVDKNMGFDKTEVEKVKTAEKELALLKDQEVKAIKDRMQSREQQNDRVKLISELSAIGISPIAVLPRNLWAKVCENFGLFRFEYFENGKVKFSWESFEKLYFALLAPIILYPIIVGLCYCLFRPNFIFNASCIMVLLPLTLGLMAMLAYSQKKYLVRTIIATLLTISASIIFNALNPKLANISQFKRIWVFGAEWILSLVICFFVSYVILRLMEIKAVISPLIKITPKSLLIKNMWPNKCDSIVTDSKIRISFPNPPEKFAQILKRLVEHDWKPCIAADAAAIDFSKKELSGQVVDAIQEQNEWIKNEPIVYVVKHGFAAPLAQFGDFKKEKEAIEYVKRNCRNILLEKFSAN